MSSPSQSTETQRKGRKKRKRSEHTRKKARKDQRKRLGITWPHLPSLAAWPCFSITRQSSTPPFPLRLACSPKEKLQMQARDRGKGRRGKGNVKRPLGYFSSALFCEACGYGQVGTISMCPPLNKCDIYQRITNNHHVQIEVHK